MTWFFTLFATKCERVDIALDLWSRLIQDKNAERFETNPPQLASLEGMQSLEQQLPTKLIKSNANKALMATNKGGTAGRRVNM